MKEFKILLAFFVIAVRAYAQSQCADCQVALIKDQVTSSESSYEKLDILNTIEREHYELLKRKTQDHVGGGLEIFDIFGFSASSTKSFEEFSEKRERFFQQNAFSSTRKWNRNVNTVSSSPIAYRSYSECIKLCYANNPNLTAIFGYIEYEDSLQINIKLKYQANGLGKDSVATWVTVDNATVIYEGWEDDGKWTLTFDKNEEIGLIVKRIDKFKASTLMISADGGNVYQYASLYQRKKAAINISAKVKYSKVTNSYVRDRTESRTFRSCELHNQPGNCKCTITLPNLGYGERYRNFSRIICSQDNQGAGKWNFGSGFCIPLISVNGDSTKAEVAFLTASRSCEWMWQADVFKLTSDSYDQEQSFRINSRNFKIEVPTNSVDGSCEFMLDGDLVFFKLGANDAENKASFQESGFSGSKRYYLYRLKESN